jgi:hypothetical protein
MPDVPEEVWAELDDEIELKRQSDEEDEEKWRRQYEAGGILTWEDSDG